MQKNCFNDARHNNKKRQKPNKYDQKRFIHIKQLKLHM